MACILKIPGQSKGVISFTSQEDPKLIKANPENGKIISMMRKDWIVAQHHNWQPCHFDPYYDFIFALSNDVPHGGVLMEMDCCNFSPHYFENKENNHPKFWDILYVCRAVGFKRLEVFFNTIKKIYNSGEKPKVLLICSLPEVDRIPSNFFELYLNIFSREERELFSVIAPEHDYPFTYSRETLSFFYKSSKVFLHTTDNEKHSRVACYAWSAGLPVIAQQCVGDVLSSETMKEPYFYRVSNDEGFVTQTLKALKNYSKEQDMSPVVNQFCETYTTKKLLKNLFNFCYARNMNFVEENLVLKDLDYRLGRHHSISLGSNKVEVDFTKFLSFIANPENYSKMIAIKDANDFEIEMIKLIQ